ncbi:hypothetical protein QUF75_00470 [Desulfococcaceae bacterium HSG7]|nr:hypothetical protein [Desulfococcaceae bacterium HSG7]
MTLPDLEKITSLRIDPVRKESEFIFKSMVIKQPGYLTIRLETPASLKAIKPLYEIREHAVHPNGLTVITSGSDPQLELSIRPVIQNRMLSYSGYIIGILIICLLSFISAPFVYRLLQIQKKDDKPYPTIGLPSNRVLAGSALIAIIGSAFLIVVIPIKLPESSKLYYSILLMAGIGVPLFLFSYQFLSRPFYQHPVKIRINSKAWLWYAVPCYFVWTIYLLAFWPCAMSPDSLSQWNDALTGHFNDWHPAFYAMNFWVIAKIWHSPSAVAFTQILILGLTVGWGLSIMQKLGASKIAILISCLLLALSPVNGLMISTLWKDVAYSIAVLALTLIVLQIIISDGQWLTNRQALLFMGIIIALVAIYRHNGPSVALGTPIVLLVIYRRFWKQIILAFLLGIIIYVGIRGPLYGLLDIQRNLPKPNFKLVAKYVKSKTDDVPKPEATPSSTKPTFIPKTIQPKTIQALRYYADLSSTLWRIKPLEGRFRRTEYVNLWWEAEDGIRYINSNKLDIEEASLLPQIRDYGFEQYLRTISSPSKYFFWRPAFYLYVFLGSVIIASIRFSQWKFLLLLVPIILHLLPFFLISTSKAIFRYHYSIAIISMVLSLPFLFIKQSSK